MALRNTLTEVVEFVRQEARLSTNSSRGTDNLENIERLIKRHYTTLAEDFDWQHLVLKRNDSAARKVLSAGQRIYSFPASVNVLKIERAWVKHSGLWKPLEYGIGPDQFNAYDSDDDERTDPVERWAFHDDDEFEVWPLPATNGAANGDGEIAFEGQRAIETLSSNSSRLDMDGIMVSLFVAAEILAGNGQKAAAEIKAAAAAARRDRMKMSLGDKSKWTMGAGQPGMTRRPRHPIYVNRSG